LNRIGLELTVRPLASPDFDRFISYWFDLLPEEVARLGVAKERLPSRNQMRADLETMPATPAGNARSFILAWCIDGKAIGHSSLKEIVYGQSANMHLHMWDVEARGKGFGPDLFCMSAVEFYDRFKLKEIFCEPKSDNPSPNRMLQRIGFPLLEQRTGAASEISAVSTLNRYLIQREIAEAHLQRAQLAAPSTFD
jgi:RimJ/RimL family protein N-acetyltransferase